MITKPSTEDFGEIIEYAPPKPAIHLIIVGGKRKKERWVLMWKGWRFDGSGKEEIKSKLLAFRKYNYHTL